MTNELQPFVKEALEKGFKKPQIREKLEAAGWPEDEIKKAVDMYADVDFPIPVPKRKPYLSAREAFLYLVLFMTLYISAIAFGTLLFQYINRWLPDAALGYSYGYDYSLDTIRSATASLIITFPIFLWLSSFREKSHQTRPGQARQQGAQVVDLPHALHRRRRHHRRPHHPRHQLTWWRPHAALQFEGPHDPRHRRHDLRLLPL